MWHKWCSFEHIVGRPGERIVLLFCNNKHPSHHASSHVIRTAYMYIHIYLPIHMWLHNKWWQAASVEHARTGPSPMHCRFKIAHPLHAVARSPRPRQRAPGGATCRTQQQKRICGNNFCVRACVNIACAFYANSSFWRAQTNERPPVRTRHGCGWCFGSSRACTYTAIIYT